VFVKKERKREKRRKIETGALCLFLWRTGRREKEGKMGTTGTQKKKRRTQRKNITFFDSKSINVNILCFDCQISCPPKR